MCDHQKGCSARTLTFDRWLLDVTFAAVQLEVFKLCLATFFGLEGSDMFSLSQEVFFILASGWFEIPTLEEPVRVDLGMLPPVPRPLSASR